MSRTFSSRLAALLLLLASPASAQELIIGGGIYQHSAQGYVGPGDIQTFTAWYGFRAYTHAIAAAATQALANIRDTTTTHTCDIIVATSGAPGVTANCSSSPDNGKSLSAWLGADPATVAKLYDQTGGSRDIVQATTANQPPLVLSCLGAMPCLSMGSASITLASAANFTPATGVVTMSAVGNRTAGNGQVVYIAENFGHNEIIGGSAVSNQVIFHSGTSFTATMADAAWHAMQGVINGASNSFGSVDGTITTGSGSPNTTAAAIKIVGVASTTVEVTELGFADNVAVSAAGVLALCDNEQTFYGRSNFSPVC